jgi:predicted transcriptional regulator
MLKALTDAVDKVRTLPPEQQAQAAVLLEDFLGHSRPDVVLDDEERALLAEGLTDIDAGRIVPAGEMAEFIKRLTR